MGYPVAKTSCEENKVIDQNRSYEQESVERALT
ncbi:protein ninF, partial [Mycobacterium tuberculosis]